MPTVQTSAHDPANRRMLFGLLLSLVAHALILSIGFGVSAMRAGGAGPITVSLAPLPPRAVSDTLPPPTETMPPTAAAPAPVPPPTRTPGSGFRLFDPVQMAPPPAPVQATEPKPARRRRSPPVKPPQRKASPVIVQQDNPDAAFKVPLADVQEEPVPEAPRVEEPEPVLAEAAPDPAAEEARALVRAEDRRQAEEEARQLPQSQEQEAERLRLADQERTRLADTERARRREEAAARERLLTDEQAARRLQDEQLRQQRAAQERREQDEARARKLAAQRALEEERARLGSAREAERVAVEEAARRMAAERERAGQQAIAEAARQRDAESARQRAQQLARQQEEERAQRQRTEQAATQEIQEQLARQAAIQQARRQAHEVAQGERARQAAQDASTNAGAGMPGMLPGNGAGGTSPRGTLDGAGLASRAREMMRGIELPGAPPAALRPAQQMQDGRRRVVDTLERDVPLRFYVDSFRQKIERNAAQIRMEVAGGPGRADPLVSVALRSDGSVDDVTIVRSSGRADLDEAVRRIVRLNARYAAFPPNVAARFDVIEIRRIWLFAERLKLLEEVR